MTNMSSTGETILKTDARGRVHTPKERRERLLDEFERSGLSGAKFAELAGIKYQTFASWAARRRKQRGDIQAPAKTADPVQWLEAVITEAKAPSPIAVPPVKLRLPKGECIEVTELNQVSLAVALARALEKAGAAC
jgi:hypothetical protein